jgi:predicted dienelactone hydrolase
MKGNLMSVSRICAVLTILTGTTLPLVADDYDPLSVASDQATASQDLSVYDTERQREIPLRVYLPTGKDPAAVILFSHGLGGSRTGGSYLGKHWSARGYVVVFMQHHGSDESVWKDAPLLQRMVTLKQAASLKNTLDRFQDVSAVLNQLDKWNLTTDHLLSSRLDMQKVGMSGHSFGAITTQGVSGQSFGRLGQRYTDSRIDAAIAFSPSSPRRGDPKQAFGSVRIPWLLMTGTKDTSPINDTTAESRMEVYPALSGKTSRYELVLHDALHSAFGDGGRLPGERGRRNPNHHKAILAVSTAFWDTHLHGNKSAESWLHGPSARSVLEQQDRWQLQTP